MVSAKKRIHFMDPLRSILMMLGVVIHSAQVFSPAQSWLIYSESTSYVSVFLIELLHLFRMPAFFVISGFFCYLTLRKYGVKKFLSSRLFRIAVPFVVTAIFLNSLQEYLLVTSGWKIFNLAEYLTTGGYVYHLWFLINIIMYFCISGAFMLLASTRLIAILIRFIDTVAKTPIIIILSTLPLFTLSIMALNKIGFPLYVRYFGVINTYELLYYLPFFLFGIVLGIRRDLLHRFATLNPLVSCALIFCFVMLSQIVNNKEGLLVEVVKAYSRTFEAWLAISVCFYLFYKFLDRPSKVWIFLSEASYSVYLFHHVLVIMLGLILIDRSVPWYFGLPILMVITLALSLSLHVYVVKKYAFVEFLFNGKRLIKKANQSILSVRS